MEAALPDYARCIDTARRMAPRYITWATGDKNPVVQEQINGFVASGESEQLRMATSYQCFPDTVDPRGGRGNKQLTVLYRAPVCITV